jgi:sec-independent protein translocase protein TatC
MTCQQPPANCYTKCLPQDLVVFLEAPVAETGVRFLQLSPGEFFFTTLKARAPPAAGVMGVLWQMPAWGIMSYTRGEAKVNSTQQ